MSGTASGRWGARSLSAVAAIFAAFLALPIVVLVGRAVLDGSLAGAARTPGVGDALSLSLVTTAASLLLSVALGLPLAYVLARRRFPGKWIIDAVVDLPIVLPPSVAGLALLLVFGRRGVLGEPLDVLGIAIPFTTVAVVLAQTFVSAPFFIRAARTGFATVDRDLEDAARVDGASDLHLFRTITMPLASQALAAGLVMTWARSLGEFGATIMFAGSFQGVTQTLSLAIYAQFDLDFDVAISLGAMLVVVCAAILLAVKLVPAWARSSSTSIYPFAPSRSS